MIYSEEELKQMALSTFEFNPECKKLHATSDGNFFLEENYNAAEAHAKYKGGVRTPLRIYSIFRNADTAQEAEENNLKTMTVAEVKLWAAGQNDIEELRAALDIIETKGGRSAVEARIQELAADAAPLDSPEKRGNPTTPKDEPKGEAPGGEGEEPGEGETPEGENPEGEAPVGGEGENQNTEGQ